MHWLIAQPRVRTSFCDLANEDLGKATNDSDDRWRDGLLQDLIHELRHAV